MSNFKKKLNLLFLLICSTFITITALSNISYNLRTSEIPNYKQEASLIIDQYNKFMNHEYTSEEENNNFLSSYITVKDDGALILDFPSQLQEELGEDVVGYFNNEVALFNSEIEFNNELSIVENTNYYIGSSDIMGRLVSPKYPIPGLSGWTVSIHYDGIKEGYHIHVYDRSDDERYCAKLPTFEPCDESKNNPNKNILNYPKDLKAVKKEPHVERKLFELMGTSLESLENSYYVAKKWWIPKIVVVTAIVVVVVAGIIICIATTGIATPGVAPLTSALIVLLVAIV